MNGSENEAYLVFDIPLGDIVERAHDAQHTAAIPIDPEESACKRTKETTATLESSSE